MQEVASLKRERWALYCGFIFIALIAIFWLGVAHFILPAHADWDLAQTLQYFVEEHHWGMIIGNSLGLIVGAMFLTPASVMMALTLARIEGKTPVWSYTCGVGGIMIGVIIFLNGCAWITCSYRPWAVAEVVQSWSDWAWLAFLLGWVYLEIEILASGIVNFSDKSDDPLVPKWFTWVTMLCALLLIGAAGIAFFQSGPFSYHGILGYYVPMVTWAIWLIGELIFMLKRNKRDIEAAQLAAKQAE